LPGTPSFSDILSAAEHRFSSFSEISEAATSNQMFRPRDFCRLSLISWLRDPRPSRLVGAALKTTYGIKWASIGLPAQRIRRFSESHNDVACTGDLTPFQADVKSGMGEFRQCTTENQLCGVA
jgi:hypothetical protein